MSSNDLNAERTQFQIFCDKLGKKYAEDYSEICIDQAYNSAKTLAPNIDVHQYIQAASEQIFYYLLQKKFPNLEHDKKINPLNNTDVDIVSDQSSPALHIEVKTPEIFQNTEAYEKGKIYGQINHRYPDDVLPKESANEALEEVTNSFGKIAKSLKMRDNKVKDYLLGANEKFTSPKANCVNCLLICLSSEEMGHFCDYILNEYTGLFSEKPFIKPELFQNVECIILSNCVEAHLDPTLGFNSWDGAEYVNFVIPNHCLKVVPEKIDFLRALFKDRFMDYAKDRDSYMRIGDSGPLGDSYGFCEYLAQKFPQFQMNKNCRIY